MPVGFKAQSVVESVVLERLQLSHPVDHPGADGRPFIFVVGLANYILAVAMSDALFWQQIVTRLIGSARERCRISRIPVQHKIPVWNCVKDRECLLTRRRVA